MKSKSNLGFGSSNQKKNQLKKYDLKFIEKTAEDFLNKGNLDKALVLYEKITKAGIKSAESYLNLSRIYRELNRREESIQILEKSFKFVSNSTSNLTALAYLYKENNYLDKCFKCLKIANSIEPENVFILELLAPSSIQINNLDIAYKCLSKLQELKPNDSNTLINFAYLYLKRGDLKAAKKYFEESLSIEPLNSSNCYGLGLVLSLSGKYLEAISYFEKAIALKPKFEKAISELMKCQSIICDWDGLNNNMKKLEYLGLNNESLSPFMFLTIEDNPLRHFQRAKIRSKDFDTKNDNKINLFKNEKIRIGYFSSDFFEHATMQLMKRIFELHDVSKFEIFVYSYGSQRDHITNWLKNKVFSFHDISELSDFDAAEFARQHNLDIAVDLKGHTLNSRLSIFSYRVSKIQITYLGYPGTTGLKTMDYIIADKEIIHEGEENFYQEKIIKMPNSYQCNDDRKEILEKKFKKSELGLPFEGFVFTCFNSTQKITEEVFEIWMKLLLNVDKSVLWLLKSSNESKNNLELAAVKNNIDPSRIVFAEKMPLKEHLARHDCGDLFLDTFNCNAHTTASDALWAGMPMISLKGKSFASRVGSSLLNALNMTELICRDKSEYYKKAFSIAKDPKLLNQLKEKIKKEKLSSPLFDSKRFTRDLENIYITLVKDLKN